MNRRTSLLMNTDWIGPAVTAAIITVIASLYINHRQHSLNYITSERTSWRLRIKGAIQDLLSSFGDSCKTELALQKVKSELNPYGRFTTNQEITESVSTPSKRKKSKNRSSDNDLFYLRDGHIWEMISSYEADPTNCKILNTLIILLELLLKFDWERSKCEVAGFTTFLPAILLWAFGNISFLFCIIKDLSFTYSFYYIIPFIVTALCIFLPSYLLFRSSASHQPSNISIILVSIFTMFPATIAYVLFTIDSKNFLLFFAATAFFLSALFSIAIYGKRDKEREYINMIKKVFNQDLLDKASMISNSDKNVTVSVQPTILDNTEIESPD